MMTQETRPPLLPHHRSRPAGSRDWWRSRCIALSRPPAAQRMVVLGTLLGLIRGVVRTLF